MKKCNVRDLQKKITLSGCNTSKNKLRKNIFLCTFAYMHVVDNGIVKIALPLSCTVGGLKTISKNLVSHSL